MTELFSLVLVKQTKNVNKQKYTYTQKREKTKNLIYVVRLRRVV